MENSNLFKSTIVKVIVFFTGFASVAFNYVAQITVDNAAQYIAIAAVITGDSIFGIIAGKMREGFQTRKALKGLKYCATWWLILTLILLTEKGVPGTEWLSEAILIPFIVFYFISILKNAHLAKLIDSDLVAIILKNIDKHKDFNNKIE